MMKLTVCQNGVQETLFELNSVEALNKLFIEKEFKLINTPSSVITFKIDGTDFFFRDENLIKKILKEYNLKTKKRKKTSLMEFTKK